MARIEVDRTVCIGSGLCAWNAPEVFEQDEEGLSRVLPDAAARSGQGPDEGAVEEAMMACPAQAIRLTEV
uniref:Ferredoxin n=1 Tax=Streptomyces sp. NBC_00008 TaxID=2903610 RepID=A0AAU2W4C7_9ACTN